MRRGGTNGNATHFTSLEGEAFFDRLSDIHAPVDVTIYNVDLWGATRSIRRVYKWRSVRTVENCPYSSVPTTERSLSVKRSLSTSMVLAAQGPYIT